MLLRKSCLDCPFREKGPISGQTDGVVSKFSDSLNRYSAKGKGRAVFNEGQPVDGLFFLCNGIVKLTKWLPSGDEIIVDVMSACTLVSSPADIGAIHRLSAVPVQADVEVAFLRVQSLGNLAGRFPELQTSLLYYSSQLLDETRERFAQCRLAVSERLMAILLRLRSQCSPDPGSSFQLPLSFSELAQFAHTTLETVSRSFGKLQRQGLISFGRGNMVTVLRSKVPDKRVTKSRHPS